MNVFGVGPLELLVILVLALIVFGPEKLPEIGRNLGRAVGQFRRMSEELTRDLSIQLEEEVRAKEEEEQATRSISPAASAGLQPPASPAEPPTTPIPPQIAEPLPAPTELPDDLATEERQEEYQEAPTEPLQPLPIPEAPEPAPCIDQPYVANPALGPGVGQLQSESSARKRTRHARTQHTHARTQHAIGEAYSARHRGTTHRAAISPLAAEPGNRVRHPHRRGEPGATRPQAGHLAANEPLPLEVAEVPVPEGPGEDEGPDKGTKGASLDNLGRPGRETPRSGGE